MSGRCLILSLALAISPVFAQLPASDTLSDRDQLLFRAEIARIEARLKSAPDKAAVTYQLARVWGSAKQWPETIEWLRKVAELRVGLDPARDSIFGELRGTREFDEILDTVRRATPPVSHSTPAFTVPEGDLVPESMAYDPRHGRFYFGSMTKGRVMRCSPSGNCKQFAGGLGTVLGIKVSHGALWLLTNSSSESALVHFDLASARIVRAYSVHGSGHNFNDLSISPAGDIYFTDTAAAAVWHLPKDADRLTQLAGRFDAANGIALSADARLLYVSTFPDGITVVDLNSGLARPIARPSDLCLAAIDGLYFDRGTLIAIQNGFMTPRVVRFTLDRDLRLIRRLDVLERRNPLFDGVTTGVVVGRDFFYMANIQDDKKTGFSPITILKLHL